MDNKTDLKLMDEILCDMKGILGCSWKELEEHSSITIVAMARLRAAWKNHEMEMITASLAQYFGNTK